MIVTCTLNNGCDRSDDNYGSVFGTYNVICRPISSSDKSSTWWVFFLWNMHNIILCCWNMLLKCVTDVHQSAKFNTCKLQRWFSSQNRKKVNILYILICIQKSSFNTLWTFIEWHPFLKMCVHVGAYLWTMTFPGYHWFVFYQLHLYWIFKFI